MRFLAPPPSFVFAGRLHRPRRSVPSQPARTGALLPAPMHGALGLHAKTLILKRNARIKAVKYDAGGLRSLMKERRITKKVNLSLPTPSLPTWKSLVRRL